jgi:hypothetical protein
VDVFAHAANLRDASGCHEARLPIEVIPPLGIPAAANLTPSAY